MNKRKYPSQQYIKELLHYNQDTGIFTWLKDRIDHINGVESDNSWNNLRGANNGN